MKLTILGGGGFRVPLVFQALLADHRPGSVSEVALYDQDPTRAQAIAAVLAEQAASTSVARRPPRVTVHSELPPALRGADFVFSAIRVGGLPGRTVDERVALRAGVIGQETVGAGGVAFGLRTVPVALELARQIEVLAPQAWVINFTNPAGLVTEAMRTVLGDRVIGICDSPSGLVRRALQATRSLVAGPPAATDGSDADAPVIDYVGLNHLGWLRAISFGDVDVLPALLADTAALESFEEGRLFGTEWLTSLGAIPNEYLHFYYFARESLASLRSTPSTRGEYLLGQQDDFYAAVQADPSTALTTWRRVRRERDATYLAEARSVAGAGERDEQDLQAGGYEEIALQLMRAIAHDEPATLIVDVANDGTLDALDTHAVIEVPCRVDAGGARPLPLAPLTNHQAGLICTVKAVERSVIEAAVTGSAAAAVRAFALHPLVDSVSVARQLLADYQRELPELHYLR